MSTCNLSQFHHQNRCNYNGCCFSLHLQINPPDTFGGIAWSVLNQVMDYSGNVIHFVADKWLTPPVKDGGQWP